MEPKALMEKLRQAGFEVIECPGRKEANDWLCANIASGAGVGLGGSMSVRELGALEALAAKGCKLYTSWGAKPEDVPKQRALSREADVYLSSVNAVTADGRLMFIDGTCNRVGAILDGPKNVFFVVGRNKLVAGGIQAAYARVKQLACPPNARRLGLDTPCAHTGQCNESACGGDCMCRATVVLERALRNHRMAVLLVDEDLGY